MSYDLAETSTAEGRPYFLYLFAEGERLWRFTSRADDWLSPAAAFPAEGVDLNWAAAAISHGAIVQSSDPRRVDLSVTLPLSDAFARRYLGPRSGPVSSLTIFRGHEQLPAEVVAHWKGRVVSARTEGPRITLRCESLFTAMRRAGVRAKYQRLCRHPLYSRGCRLDIETYFVGGAASARAGNRITVAEAALLPDGWFRGGVLRHAGAFGFIIGHSGASLTLAGRMPELEAAIDAALAVPDTLALIEMAPGCDLRSPTCKAKFGNLLNFGGFPDIPGRNPFGGTSIV
jgi:uncharacterized phage protein (TIGR02218 family)